MSNIFIAGPEVQQMSKADLFYLGLDVEVSTAPLWQRF